MEHQEDLVLHVLILDVILALSALVSVLLVQLGMGFLWIPVWHVLIQIVCCVLITQQNAHNVN